MKNLTLIIPAKNEAESLPTVLDELRKYALKIIVVLHKSDLNTIEAIKDYPISIIYQDNKGYGDALIKGIYSCKSDYFSIFNADGSFDPYELKKMYKKMKDDSLDILFASRYLKNASSEDDTLITFVGNKIFTLMGKILFSLPISDILYTFVIGNTKKVSSLNLKQKNFTLCVELPIIAKKNNLKISDISSNEKSRIGGVKKVNELKDGFLILLHMIKLFFKR